MATSTALSIQSTDEWSVRVPLGPTAIGSCSIAIVLAVCAAALGIFPGAAGFFEFDREAIASGQIWRLLTGHLVHWNTDHLFWDVTMFALLGGICERRNRRRFLAVLLTSALLISIGVWIWYPDLIIYRGLSGIDSAFFTLLAVSVLGEQMSARRWTWSLAIGGLLVAFVGKIGFEVSTGMTLFVDSQAAGFTPIPLSHLVGALVGAAAGVMQMFKFQ